MNVMIVGASGFIGGRLAQALGAAGHAVVCAGRGTPARLPAGCARWVTLDFAAPQAAEWSHELAGVDVLINTVGILRENDAQSFEALHVLGPRALFTAAAIAHVRRVIQVSALGADADATSRYHTSKREADRFLMELPLDWAIVQPSIVYGAGGASARMFETLASLPILPVPAGNQRVQPVHIDDLVDTVTHLVESPAALHCVLPVVGPREMTLREFLVELRGALGMGRARTLSMPGSLVAFAARLGEKFPSPLLDPETLGMLERGNVGPAGPMERLLGRPATPVARFVSPARRESRRAAASLRWITPLLRISIAAMWLIAGIVSLGAYPVQDSVALLMSMGVSAALAPLLLFGAAALDILLGVMTLLPRRPRWLWTAQILLVAVYTLIISVELPALWLQPFGPVAKNLPILALLILLRQLEERR